MHRTLPPEPREGLGDLVIPASSVSRETETVVSKRNENSKRVVIKHNDGSKDIWRKNDAGRTTKEGHSKVHRSGNETDHYGKMIRKKR
jgi:hypothetical protein